MFKNLRFKQKLVLYGIASTLVFVFIFGAYYVIFSAEHAKKSYDEVYTLLLNLQKNKVETTINGLVTKYRRLIKSGVPLETIKVIINGAANVTYGNGRYIFVLNRQGVMVADPLEPKWDGKNVYNVRDVKGNYPFRKMIELSKTKGSGFVHYLWKNPRGGIEEKITYINTVPKLNWIVASGVYLKKINIAAAKHEKVIKKDMEQSYIIGLGVTIFALIIVFIIGSLMAGKLMAPIKQMSHNLEELETGDGDLTKRVTLTTKDEFKDLADKLNNFIDGIQQLVKDIKNSAKNVIQESESLSSSSNETAATVEETTQNLGEMVGALNDMAEAVDNVAKSAEGINEQTGVVGEINNKMLEDIKERVERMDKNATLARKAMEQINSVGDSSKQIGQIVNVINEIADQTNLLALNAAIEAARAGEAGRGFAVVADEVRKLAEKTQHATEEIRNMITTMQQDTQKSIDMTRKAEEGIVKEREKSIEDEGSIKEMVEQISKTIENVNSTSAATEELSATVAEINMQSQEIKQAAEDNSQVATQIAEMSEKLKNEANKLDGLVKRFKV